MPHKIRPRCGIYFSVAVLKKTSFGIIVQKKLSLKSKKIIADDKKACKTSQ